MWRACQVSLPLPCKHSASAADEPPTSGWSGVGSGSWCTSDSSVCKVCFGLSLVVSGRRVPFDMYGSDVCKDASFESVTSLNIALDKSLQFHKPPRQGESHLQRACPVRCAPMAWATAPRPTQVLGEAAPPPRHLPAQCSWGASEDLVMSCGYNYPQLWAAVGIHEAAKATHTKLHIHQALYAKLLASGHGKEPFAGLACT